MKGMTGRGTAGLRPCMWELASGCLPEDWAARMSAKEVRACSMQDHYFHDTLRYSVPYSLDYFVTLQDLCLY